LLLLRRFLRGSRSQPKHLFALALLVATNQVGIVALAGGPSGDYIRQSACAASSDIAARDACAAQPPDGQLHADLPADGQQCPASGLGASCGGSDSAASAGSGTSSIPDGLDACPVGPDKTGPNAPASCSDNLLPAPAAPGAGGRLGVAIGAPAVLPSVPALSLQYSGPQQRLQLSTTTASAGPGQSTVLVATSNVSVTGTPNAIEIFDETAGALAGACLQSSQCQVGYSAQSGTHTFAAFVTPPTSTIPGANVVAQSNSVSVTWLGVKLDAGTESIVAPGKSVTFTATATSDVAGLGSLLELYDKASGARVTYCSRGTTCRTSLTQRAGGVRAIVAVIAGPSDSLPASGVRAASEPVSATWLSVSLQATTTFPRAGGTVYLQATSNADLTGTPWSIGIYDQDGHLVGQPCKASETCSAKVMPASGSTPWFSAVVGALAPPDNGTLGGQMLSKVAGAASLVNVQARSSTVQPKRLLWGVDSCRSLTDGLYAQVVATIGSPDFWGRYLTTTPNCPGLSSDEVAAAAAGRMGFLPIYNDYECSAVSGYDVGKGYAVDAGHAARSLGIPRGRVIAIDIEPPGPWCSGAVDGEFIKGWYDSVTLSGYAPAYYGNGTDGSVFAQAWCGAVGDRPEIAFGSYVWSFEPSLLGSFSKAGAPEFAPYQPSCGGNFAAWQYQISGGGTPDVDHDEALSSLPLWFP
jgi:glycoside hydrolase-like protein